MSTIQENKWPLGWIPSHSQQAGFEGSSGGLLRMDNLTVDEIDTLRISKTPTIESDSAIATTNSIYGAYISSKKYRYLYTTGGALLRNWDASGANTLTDYGKTIFTGGTTPRAAFLNAIGQILIAAGTKKYKDNGTDVFPLGIAAPTNPTFTVNSASTVAVDNKDGSAHYTNWASIESSAIDGSSTYLSFTTNATTQRSAVKTVFSGTLDSTNLGGTGKDTPDDLLKFNIYIDDPSKVLWVQLEFCGEAVTGSAVLPDVTNYYLHFWDAQATDGPYKWFSASPGAWTPVEVRRGDFQRFGVDATKTWANIKSIRMIVGCVDTVNFRFNDMYFQGGETGPLDGLYKYVTIEVRDTGDYVEFGLNSTPVEVTAYHSSIHVNRSGAAVAAQANGIWYFRFNETTGDYLAVHREYGANGFTPAAFDDSLSDDDAIASAASDPQFTLEYYRTALPDDIIGMIWFRDRVIYLNAQGFIPSFKLDPGSYDSRFIYEVAGSTSEQCLFLAKLDVGTFIVATTHDFYRVTGTFTETTIGSVTLQDVNIYALGVTDPTISSSFLEIEGSIMYMSASGIRTLTNGTSALVNGNLDLLFKGEARYGWPAVAMSPNDASFIACATSGNRIYWSAPCTDSKNRVFVNTLKSDGSYWRALTDALPQNNPRCMFREEDGTIIYGSAGTGTGFIRSLETSNSTSTIHFQTQLQFGGSPNQRKDATSLAMYVNTGGKTLNLLVTGVDEAGNFNTKTFSLMTLHEQLVYLDIKETLAASIAYGIEGYCTTSSFSMNYWLMEVQPRAILTRRAFLIAAQPNNKLARRAITTWPFRINPLGNIVTCRVFADGVLVDVFGDVQTFSGSITMTECWVSGTIAFGINWEIELVSTGEFEFYEFLAPSISQENPTPVNRVKLPYTALGTAGRKTVQTWPLRANLVGGTATITVRCDGVDIEAQTITGADIVQVFKWISNTSVLGAAWEIEVISTTLFEFYEFLEPTISQICPVPVLRVIFPYDNFKSAMRKQVDSWPLRCNLINGTASFNVGVDRVEQTPVQTATGGDFIETYRWINRLNTKGVDWKFEIIFSSPAEFYEFLTPIMTQTFAELVYHAILPYNNFGKTSKKIIQMFPFILDSLGRTVKIRVFADGTEITTGTKTISSTDIRTLYWRNTAGVAAVDWKVVLSCYEGMEFYKFLPPTIEEVFPDGQYWLQLGPIDLNAQGMVYGMRIRIISEATQLLYKVLNGDVVLFEDILTVVIGVDDVYEVKFPKGVDASVCKIILTSEELFYKFSAELHVRITGKETEGKYVRIE